MSKPKRSARAALAPAPAEPRRTIQTPAELQLDELSALRLSRASAVLELGRARVAGLRAEAVRLLEQIDVDGRFRSLDRQIGEVLPHLVEAETEVGKLSAEIGARLGIDPAAYYLDDRALILRARPPSAGEEA
jgi:hypothetical protein